MSDHQIAAAVPVEGELVVHGMRGMIMAEVQQPNSQATAPLLVLYEVRLTTMHGAGMLLKGEERPEGDKGQLTSKSGRFVCYRLTDHAA